MEEKEEIIEAQTEFEPLDEKSNEKSKTENEVNTENPEKAEETEETGETIGNDLSKKDDLIEKDQDLEQKILQEVMKKLKDKSQKDAKDKQFYEMNNQKKLAEEKITKNMMLKNALNMDMQKIENFARQGLITAQQGQNLKNLVIKRAFDKYLENGIQTIQPKKEEIFVPENEYNFERVMNEFQKEKPRFFEGEGRKDVLEYIKSSNLGKDEMKKISELVESVEKNAIDRYVKKTDYEKKLQKSNDEAKQKLKANAQTQGFSDTLGRLFTRNQIGKMTSAEFVKNEKEIMSQLRKGLIK